MQDPALYLTIALAGLAGLSIVTMATLRGWNGWLELKRAELGHRGEASAPPSAAAPYASSTVFGNVPHHPCAHA